MPDRNHLQLPSYILAKSSTSAFLEELWSLDTAAGENRRLYVKRAFFPNREQGTYRRELAD